MNSTLKSLVFWIVLIVVGGLVWNFSTRFQTSQKPETFSEFMAKVDSGQVARVTITGNEITYTTKASDNFRTYAPPQYEGLANKLIDRNVVVAARPMVIGTQVTAQDVKVVSWPASSLVADAITDVKDVVDRVRVVGREVLQVGSRWFAAIER